MRVFLTSVLLLAATATHSATIFVDPNGVCGGEPTCFTSIQQGINNAVSGDELRVFSATYFESVDISLMGSALGPAADGDITITAVDASNIPAPGTVLLRPPTGACLFHSNSFFIGNVSIIGLDVQSVDDDGIDLDLVQGNLLFRDVTANGSGADGIDTETATGPWTTTLERVTASGNQSIGLNLDAADGGFMNVQDIEAHDNGDEGLYMEVASTGDVVDMQLMAVTTTNNGHDTDFAVGTAVSTDGSVSIAGLTANDNAGPGLVALDTQQLNLRDSTTNGNGIGNGFDGVLLINNGDTHIRRLHAQGNDAAGVWVDSAGAGADHQITCSYLEGNDHGVFYVGALPAASYHVSHNTIANNTSTGIFQTSNLTVEALDNWWGDATGPTHSANPGGIGDVIADSVNVVGNSNGTVNFTPFLTSAPTFFQFAADTLYFDGFDDAPCLVFESN